MDKLNKDIWTNNQIERHEEKQIDRQDRLADRQIDIYIAFAEGQTDAAVDRHNQDKQTDRQIKKDR